MFAASPMDFVIEFRRYFLAFAAEYMSARLTCEHAVGCDIFGMDAAMMYRRLCVTGRRFMAMDYSGYDKTLTAPLMWSVYRVIEKVFIAAGYSEEQLKHAQCLYGVLAYPRYVIYNALYGLAKSHPSGDPITSLINSIANSIIYRYCYRRLAPRYESNFNSYHHNVTMFSYGDDNMASVSDLVSWFNQISFAKTVIELGLKVTPATKDGELTEYVEQKDISFLKRRFRWSIDHGSYIAFRDPEQVMETANWTRRTVSIKDFGKNCVLDLLFDLHLCGKEAYNKYAPKLFEALREADPEFTEPPLSYEDQLAKWHHRYKV
jgi:hypothetical protein